jgi:predicted nucleic acid-binding protein
VILVDANLLIYAVNQDLPMHPQAKCWWEKVLSGADTVGLGNDVSRVIRTFRVRLNRLPSAQGTVRWIGC